jgi:hypothetical protein
MDGLPYRVHPVLSYVEILVKPFAGRWPDTPSMGAVLALFERIGATLPAALPKPVQAILVGGAAVHVYTHSRVSHDVEAIFSHRIILPQDLLVRYTDEAGMPRQVAYDYNYFADIALMHPDYAQDAIPWGPLATGPLTLAVLGPVDLAVSKLARFQDQDRRDIAALAEPGLLTANSLRLRVEEALDYYVGDTRWIRHHLADALALIQSSVKAPR